jgi:uncharacterized membrane protein
LREAQAAAYAPEVQTGAGAIAPGRARIEAIDLVRGLIMILMALDHTRDFFGDLASQPTNLASTTTALFFTRWITHICAPVFFLLTGTSAYLMLRRVSRRELSRFLLTRGAWLIFLELTVMRFALQFNIDYHVTIITVLWGLGWAMIVLAGLIWLPKWAIATIGVIMGPALLLLRAFDHSIPALLRPALIIGKVPLFFYVLHFYLIHLLAVVASYLRYGEAGEMFQSPDVGHFPFSEPPGWGSSLPVMYLLWALVVLTMFPLCRWYAGVKRRRTDWWLSYL